MHQLNDHDIPALRQVQKTDSPYILKRNTADMQSVQQPPEGYYEKIISNLFPSVKLVKTTDVIQKPFIFFDPKDILEILDVSTDRFARYYYNHLKKGTMVAVVYTK